MQQNAVSIYTPAMVLQNVRKIHSVDGMEPIPSQILPSIQQLCSVEQRRDQNLHHFLPQRRETWRGPHWVSHPIRGIYLSMLLSFFDIPFYYLYTYSYGRMQHKSKLLYIRASLPGLIRDTRLLHWLSLLAPRSPPRSKDLKDGGAESDQYAGGGGWPRWS